MKFLVRLYRWVAGWLHDWRFPPYDTVLVQECLPKQLKPQTLYIVDEDGIEEQAAMVCPCGCGKTLQMNLLTDDRPCWHVTRHADGTASLRPSVWRQKDCRSHFWFKHGRVHWVKDHARQSVVSG